MYKLSFYNFYIPICEENMYLFYNSLKNGMYEVEWNVGEMFRIWKTNKKKELSNIDLNQIPNETIGMLKEGGFIIDEITNEQQIIKKRQHEMNNVPFKTKYTDFVLTIVPTNRCNMECSYCFLGIEKPVEGKLSEENIEHLLKYIENEIKSPTYNIEGFKKLNVTWYGGEPLLEPKVIESVSTRLMELCKKNNLEFSSDIVTNGVLLNNENWKLIKKYITEKIQITIDGYKTNHNKSRPLIGKEKESYYTILNNLKSAPDNIAINIRINIGKETIENLDLFLQDLERYGLWPQKTKTIRLYLARKIYYNINTNQNKSLFLNEREFFDAVVKFKQLKIKHYNRWSENNGLENKKMAKKKFQYPDFNDHTCRSAQHPFAINMDQDGYLYPCWEYINDKNARIGHVSDSIKREENLLYQRFKTFDKTKVCANCKFLPICDDNCVASHVQGFRKKNCCIWKYQLESILKEQYLMTKYEPEKISSIVKI